MAKPNNSGRTKRSHGSKPYDTSSSFVKRFTTRVSEILPQPSSWVSKFFSPAPKLNVRAREESDDEDEEEEERHRPPKRHCFGRPEERDYSHQNNINRLNEIGQGNVEISPILNNRLDEDLAVPGPSGLHLRNFVSSTPAVQQANAQPSLNRTPNLVKRTQVSERERNSARRSRLHLSSNSLSGLNSPSRPSFDTYVFNNPLNKSGLRPRSSLNESCFYPGETTFGGSSARVSLIAEQPRARVVNVTASPTVQRDTIGTSALRILKALEQFSTPVLDAKKIPVRTEGVNPRKRKPPQPYEELIFPTMPELLSLKRREVVGKQPAPAEDQIQPAPSTSTSKEPLQTMATTAPPISKPVASASTIDSPYSIRPESSKEAHIGSIKRGQKDADLETETLPELNLPNVQLNIASLPKFELSASSQQVKSSPQPKKPVTAPTSPPQFKFSEPEILEKVSSEKIIVDYLVKTFKFSDPLPSIEFDKKTPASHHPTPKHNSSSKKNILEVTVPNMKVSSPNFKLKRKSIESTPKIESYKGFELKMPSEMKTGSIMEVFNLNNTQPLQKQSKPSENNLYCHKCKASYDKDKGKCTCENSIGSIKPPSSDTSRSKWECKKCQLKNDDSEIKCKQCNLEKGSEPSKVILKGFEGYRKPTDSWECKECLVQNKDSSEACVSCSTPKAGKSSVKAQAIASPFSFVSNEKKTDSAVKTSAPLAPLVNSIVKPQGSWECDTCLVQNKADITSCAACSTPKPGSAPAEKPKLAFSFGIPTTASETNSFHFGADKNAQKNDIQSQYSFASSNEDKKNNLFNFGSEQKNDVSKTSTVLPPLTNSFKKYDQWECGTCLVQNKNDVTSCVACSTSKPGSDVAAVEKPKQVFSFGVPNSSLATTNATNVQFGSNFNSQNIENTSTQSQPQFTFGSQPDEKKAVNPSDLFKFGSVDSKPNNEYKPAFSFMNSEKPKENDQTKRANSNLFSFGSNIKENKIDDTNAVDGKPPKKKVSFGNPLTSEKHVSNDSNSTMFGNAMSTKPNDIGSSNFSFTAKSPFENNSTVVSKEPMKATPVISFVFGNAEPNVNIRSSIPEPAKSMSFIVPPTEPSVVSNNDHPSNQNIFGGSTFTGFNKPSEPENKPFSFLGNSQGNQGGGQFTFNAISSAPVAGAVEPFGNQQPSMFSQQQAPASSVFSQHQVEPKPFVFAAPPQQHQPSPFNFGAPQGAGIGGNTAFSGFSQPANPAPVFDPNAKPTFNFTGGTTPSFSAAPSVNSTGAEGGPEKRRVRKAIRRTQPR